MKTLVEIKRNYPDLRYGQILCNALYLTCPDLYYLDDNILQKRLSEMYPTEKLFNDNEEL